MSSGRAGMVIRRETDAEFMAAVVLWLRVRQEMPARPQRQPGAVGSPAGSGILPTAARGRARGGRIDIADSATRGKRIWTGVSGP